jgi:hypothetical protein
MPTRETTKDQDGRSKVRIHDATLRKMAQMGAMDPEEARKLDMKKYGLG